MWLAASAKHRASYATNRRLTTDAVRISKASVVRASGLPTNTQAGRLHHTFPQKGELGGGSGFYLPCKFGGCHRIYTVATTRFPPQRTQEDAEVRRGTACGLRPNCSRDRHPMSNVEWLVAVCMSRATRPTVASTGVAKPARSTSQKGERGADRVAAQPPEREPVRRLRMQGFDGWRWTRVRAIPEKRRRRGRITGDPFGPVRSARCVSQRLNS